MSPVRPCSTPGCPRLTRRTRCPTHETEHQSRRNTTRRQYTGNWKTTSRKARAEQPWCTRCGTTIDLTLDHETGTVECRPCNSGHRRNPGG